MNFKSLFDQHREKILHDYFTFLRFKSISTDPQYLADSRRCAEWLVHYLQEGGLHVESWETEKTPVIFASSLHAGPDKETLLLYCHYDVQPVDPLEEWTSPPFEPTLREGSIYARGAADNKGQCFYTLSALLLFLKERKKFPINVKFIIEGEEESGSRGLALLLKEKKEALQADYLLIVDSGMEERDLPAITLGARGLVCLQVTLQEALYDLHSGSLGGLAYNPNRALVELLSSLHDKEGRVTIPHFYDQVTPLLPEEKEEISFAFDEEKFQKMFGFQPTGMEKNVPPKEAGSIRPTLEINGITGGYGGAGFKTVIPAKASAKLSCRLVPHQKPLEIAHQVRDFLLKKTPIGMRMEVDILPGMGEGFRTSPHTQLAHLTAACYTEVFGKPCQKILLGGTIPIAVELAKTSGAEMILIGVGLPDDHIHSPDERFDMDRFEKGFLTICTLLNHFS